MLSHKQLSAWYLQLAQQLEAGMTLAQAMPVTAAAARLPSSHLQSLGELVGRGATVAEVFEHLRPALPRGDRLFLSAAAEGGRLPVVLRNLSARHAQLHRATLRLALASAYPVAVLHLGLLLLPLASMIDWEHGFRWNAVSYLRAIALTVGPLWLLLTVGIALGWRQSPLVGRLGRLLPGFRGMLIARGVADFAFALGTLLETGTRVDRAWQIAGDISDSATLQTASRAVVQVIDRGDPASVGLSSVRSFPPDFLALYRSGEVSGRVEENLFRVTLLYQERSDRCLTLASIFYPALLLGAVLILVGYHVVTFYSGYLKMLTELGSG